MPIFNPPQLVQTAIAKLGSNITSTGAFGTILTITITTTGGSIVSHATATSSNSANPAVNEFRIQIDGSTVATGSSGWDGGSLSATSIQTSVALLGATAIAAGSHTITLQWTTTAGTGRINGSTGTNGESAVLYVEEVTV